MKLKVINNFLKDNLLFITIIFALLAIYLYYKLIYKVKELFTANYNFPSLKAICKKRKIPMYFGSALNYSDLSDINKTNIIKYTFKYIEPINEMKWQSLRENLWHINKDTTNAAQTILNRLGTNFNNSNTYTFNEADSIASFASSNKLTVRGHNFSWGGQMPRWLYTLDELGVLNRSNTEVILKSHISTVMNHYYNNSNLNVIRRWDVINELLDNDGDIKQTHILGKYLGMNLFKIAFQEAHNNLPNKLKNKACLYYNDFSLETKNDKAHNILQKLKYARDRLGAPIQGVGFQFHISIDRMNEKLYDIERNIKKYRDAGFDVNITEIDINGSSDQRQNARMFSNIVNIGLNQGVSVFQLWNTFDTNKGFFDNNFRPNLAYSNVCAVLSNYNIKDYNSKKFLFNTK